MHGMKPGGFAFLLLVTTPAQAGTAPDRAAPIVLPPRYTKLARPTDFRQMRPRADSAMRSQHLALDTDIGSLLLDASHLRTGIGRSRNLVKVQQSASRWRMDVAYLLRPLAHDMLRLDASLRSDRRKPTIPLDRARWLGSSARVISLGWQHDERFLLDGGWFDNRSTSGRSRLDRAIVIASGGPIAEHGPRLKAEFTPAGRMGGMTLGLETATMAIAASDRLALDTARARDMRTTVSLRLPFQG